MPQLTAIYFNHIYLGEIFTIITIIIFISKSLLPQILMIKLIRNIIYKL